MKNILIIFGLLLSLKALSVLPVPIAHGQAKCATINAVSITTSQVESGKEFQCIVGVDAASKASSQRSIACGLSFDGGFPLDFCPSTPETFGGWDSSGNAIFRCIVPNTNVKAQKVEAVGYDFQSGCGPQTGKRADVALKVSDANKTDPVNPEDQVSVARKLFGILTDFSSKASTAFDVNTWTPETTGANSSTGSSSSQANACYGDDGTYAALPMPDFAALGLPQPTASGPDGYQTLGARIANNPRAKWAVQQLLRAEKIVLQKRKIVPYLTTAWLWFENGSSGYPDPYAINCNDNRSLSQVSVLCNTNNFQIAGYQAANRRGDYLPIYRQFYGDSDLKNVMQKVVDNSTGASRPEWSYLNAAQKTGLVANLEGGTRVSSKVSTADIATGSDFFDGTKQFHTLLIGKDPVMVIALNGFAVSDGDLVKTLKNSNCGYGYICAPEKQLLSNIMYALHTYDVVTNTKVGQVAIQAATNIASYLNVVAAIRSNCKGEGVTGRVTSSNADCVQGTTSNSVATTKWKASARSFTYLQCVGFVYGMMAVGHNIDMYCGGNAVDMPTTCPATGKFTFTKNGRNTGTMKVGDAVVWGMAPYGHVAYVVSIYDKTNFQIAEANFDNAGTVRLSNITVDSPGLLGWLRLK